MSTRTEMYKRILAAMPDDEEVAQWCRSQIDRAGASAAKTEERIDLAKRAANAFTKGDANVMITAKEFAAYVTENADESWNTRTASYYLRQLVAKGVCQEVKEEGYSSPKRYVMAA